MQKKKGKEVKGKAQSKQPESSAPNLEQAIAYLEKEKGHRVVKKDEQIEWVSTGSYILDKLTGGGIPRGRVTELYGAEKCGKSTISIHACIEAHKAGLHSVYLAYEGGFDVNYAKSLGLLIDYWDRPSCHVFRPFTFEDGDEILAKILPTKQVGLVVIDSVPSMLPQLMFESGIDEIQPALHARYMNKFIGKYSKLTTVYNTAFILVNQFRTTVKMSKFQAAMPSASGPDLYRPGGVGLVFAGDLRIRLKMKAQEKGLIINPVTRAQEEIPVVSVINAMVEKNKCGRGYINSDFVLTLGKGINNTRSIIEICQNLGNIKKSQNGFFSFHNLSRQVPQIRGIFEVERFLQANMDILTELEDSIKFASNTEEDVQKEWAELREAGVDITELNLDEQETAGVESL